VTQPAATVELVYLQDFLKLFGLDIKTPNQTTFLFWNVYIFYETGMKTNEFFIKFAIKGKLMSIFITTCRP
jgi:hypothetical protein